MKFVLPILLSVASFSLFGQEVEEEFIEFEDPPTTEIFSITASPLALLDIYSGSAYRLGAQFRLFKSISLGAEGGGYIESISNAITIYSKMKGVHFRGRIGYSPWQVPELSFGLEYQHKFQSFSYQDSTETLPEFTADVSKFVHCINAYGAYDVHLTERLFINFQVGFGVRYREIENTMSSVVEDGTSTTWPWDSLHGGRVTTGKRNLMNVSVAIRLGFMLAKNKAPRRIN